MDRVDSRLLVEDVPTRVTKVLRQNKSVQPYPYDVGDVDVGVGVVDNSLAMIGGPKRLTEALRQSESVHPYA